MPALDINKGHRMKGTKTRVGQVEVIKPFCGFRRIVDWTIVGEQARPVTNLYFRRARGLLPHLQSFWENV